MTQNQHQSTRQSLIGVLREHRTLVVAFVIATLAAAASEGLGVGMIVPLLDNWQGTDGTLSRIPVVTRLAQSVQVLSIENRVRLATIVLLVFVGLQSVLQYLTQAIAIQLRVNVQRNLKAAAIQQLHDLSLRYIHQQPAAHLVSIVLVETQHLAYNVFMLARIIASLSILGVYTLLMFAISWQLTLIAVGVLLLMAFVTGAFSASRLKLEGQATVKCRKDLRQIVIESLSLMKLTHLYAQEEQAIKRCNQGVETLLGHIHQSQKLIHAASPRFNISAAAGLAALLLAGTFLPTGQGEFGLARTGLFLVIVFRLLAPATTLNRAQAEFRNLYPSMQSVFDFLRRENKPYLSNGERTFSQLTSAIRLENVSFRYEPGEAPVLKNVNLEIPKGKLTAFVGASGCGKSTIVSLLARIYDPDDGAIRIDGVDLRELDLSSWRRSIAIVSQETLLQNTTIIANLRFARPTAADDDIYDAAKSAQLHDFIVSLPDGYNTIIGDNGVRLSGGQQQRMAIARALIANPQVLILDEATSALDSETERAIQEAIDRFSQGRTLLVAAHRLSTIRHADQIVVLGDGEVLEKGTHTELTQAGGVYQQLIRAQDVASRVCEQAWRHRDGA